MDFQFNTFEEYQSSYTSFGGNMISPEPFLGESEGLFHQNPSFDVIPDMPDMPDIIVPQEYPSANFGPETGSPVLPNSASVSESQTSSSSSSPYSPTISDNSMDIKQEPSSPSEQGFPTVDIAPNSVTMAPERKKKRRQQPTPKTSPKSQGSGKKRKAQSDVSEELNPDYLLQMNSVELEKLYERLKSEGRLKADDDKLLKKIIRQVKNRESAHSSRTRRRDYMEYIEAKLKHEETVSSYLRDYANQLKHMLVQNGMEVPPEPEIPIFVPPPPSEPSIVGPSRAIVRPLRTAGICLMIVVLSVGILFNAMHHSSASNTNNSSISSVSGTSDNTNLVSEPTAAADPSARVIVDGNAPMDQLPPATTESTSEMEPSLSPTKSEQHNSGEVTSLDVIRKSTYLSYDTDKTDSSLALVIPDQKQQVPTSNSVSTLVPASCPVLRYTSKAIFGDSQPHVADRSWSLGNTSYILVNDATEFVPRSVYTNSIVQTRTEPVIGLLLPASSFNISNSAPDDVVELVCGVRNANLVPRNVLAHSLY